MENSTPALAEMPVHEGRMTAGGRKFDKWLDTVYMQRALGKGVGEIS